MRKLHIFIIMLFLSLCLFGCDQEGGQFGKTDKGVSYVNYLDERLELCHRALQARHERLTGTLSDVAPILWQYGALARLKKGETIDKLLYDNYSTLSKEEYDRYIDYANLMLKASK